MKILVIEDNSEILEFISISFEVGWLGSQVICTHLGHEGIKLVEEALPDVVLLDLGLPDISGYDVLKEIRAFSSVPIIIISIRNSEADIVKGLNLGADEYVTKPFGQLEIIARVKALLRRKKPQEISSPIVFGKLNFDPVLNEISCGSTMIQLTRTEGILFTKLIENPNRLITFNHLSEALWGDSDLDSINTLRVYIRRIRAKIVNITGCQVCITSKTGLGYQLEVG